jgi:polyisoprenoid-binding protein YceI
MLRLAAACSIAVAACAQAQPVVYRFDPDNTRVHFEVLHFGTATLRGRFDRIDGFVTLDRSARSGEVSLTVDTGSVSTGLALLDALLKREDMLAAQAFPKAYFVARRIDFDASSGVSAVQGEFTLRGVSRPLTLRALRFGCREAAPPQREVCGGDFEADIRRSDFGFSFGLPFIADRVRLQVQVEGVRD